MSTRFKIQNHGWRLALALGALLAAFPSQALAHPMIDKALALADDLELEAAVDTFNEAIESGELERDDLVKALSERSLLLHALRRRPELMAGFKWLAAIAPEHMLDMRAPPDLTAIWTSIRNQSLGVLDVKVTLDANPGELDATLALGGTQPPDLETHFELRVGDGEWQVIEGREFNGEYPDGAEVDVFASVAGPGGFIVATDGERDDPLHVSVPPMGAMAAGGPVDSGAEQGWAAKNKWYLIGGAAGVVVIGTVLGVVLASSGSDGTKTNLEPMVEF